MPKIEPFKVLSIEEILPSHERILLMLGTPVLASIQMLEVLGYLPAIPSLPGVGAGAHVFSETRFLLVQKDHMNGEDALCPQVALFLLEAGYIKRTREAYDHHVALTKKGMQFLIDYTRFDQRGY